MLGSKSPPKSPASIYEHLGSRQNNNQSSLRNLRKPIKSCSSASCMPTIAKSWARSTDGFSFAARCPARRLVSCISEIASFSTRLQSSSLLHCIGSHSIHLVTTIHHVCNYGTDSYSESTLRVSRNFSKQYDFR